MIDRDDGRLEGLLSQLPRPESTANVRAEEGLLISKVVRNCTDMDSLRDIYLRGGCLNFEVAQAFIVGRVPIMWL